MKTGFDQTGEIETKITHEIRLNSLALISEFLKSAMRFAKYYAALKNLDEIDATLIKKCMKIACVAYHANPKLGDVEQMAPCFDTNDELDKERVVDMMLRDIDDEDFEMDPESLSDIVFSVENAETIFEEWEPVDNLGTFLKTTLTAFELGPGSQFS